MSAGELVTPPTRSDSYRGSGARGPSRLDGLPCFALFEGRASLEAVDDPIPLTDPAPRALENVAADWSLVLQPAPALPRRPRKF
jgi:hypothetical protein